MPYCNKEMIEMFKEHTKEYPAGVGSISGSFKSQLRKGVLSIMRKLCGTGEVDGIPSKEKFNRFVYQMIYMQIQTQTWVEL